MRKKINKHTSNNSTANTLAYLAIKDNASIKRDGTTYLYNKDKNRLYIDDGFSTMVYEPLITDDCIDPFYKIVTIKI